MKHITSYNIFENKTRTSPLTEEEFLDIFNKNCTQFNFKNDMLYRGCGEIGEYALYKEAEREGTYGSSYAYHDFFNQRKEYPVPRYKSAIGSTSPLHAGVFGQNNSAVYLVIPFDNSKIVFCPTPDMASGGAFRNKDGGIYSDDMFVMQEYSSNFKVDRTQLQKGADILKSKLGRGSADVSHVEFFTNADLLLYRLGSSSSGKPPHIVYNMKLNESELNKALKRFKKLINK